MSHLLRTRIKGDIVAEVGLPERSNGEAIILLMGMPALPGKSGVVRFLMKHGYSVIFPRYRGSWESGGTFLAVSPEQDVLDILDALEGDFKSAWDGDVFHVEHKKISIISSSFGGSAGLLASRDSRVSNVVAFSPVVDWGAESPEEPLDEFQRFIKEGFGEAYRVEEGGLEQLKTGEFYNPWGHMSDIPGGKIYIIHAEDDRVVLPGPIIEFAHNTGAKLAMRKKGGHFGLDEVRRMRTWWSVHRFLKN